MSEASIRVLLVDDSPSVLRLLAIAIRQNPHLELVGEASDGKEAVEAARRLHPDVISLDVNLPGQSGIEACQEIMESNPIPIVILTGLAGEIGVPFEALQAGAMAIHSKRRVLEEPGGLAGYMELLQRYSMVKPIRMRRRRLPQLETSATERILSAVSGSAVGPPAERRALIPEPGPRTCAALGIVASTGGPPIVHEILRPLPANLGGPLLIVVHLHADFVGRLVKWLDTAGKIRVLEARQGERAEPGMAYLAPADEGLLLDAQFRFSLARGCAPLELGDRMLQSLAQSFGNRSAGLVLSGMGEDGSRGLKAIKDAGGITAVQRPSTAVLSSMPEQALPYANADLPIDRLSRWVRALF